MAAAVSSAPAWSDDRVDLLCANNTGDDERTGNLAVAGNALRGNGTGMTVMADA